MRVLQVINSVDPAGGGPIESVKQMGSTLQAQGHRIEVACVDAPSSPFVKECTLPIHALGPSKLKYGYSHRLIPWLHENRSRFDVVVVNGIWQFHSYACWRALGGSATPYVVFTHGMLDPWFKKRYPLKHLKKWMYWPWADYRVLRDAKAVLSTCDEERRLARTSFWLYRCHEVVVSLGTSRPEGDADLQKREFFLRFPELCGKRVVLFMGRIHPKKGCDLLIEAFAKTLGPKSRWHLVIAGPDQVGWQVRLQNQAARLDMSSSVTWAGLISGPVKWGALRAAEVVALPSRQENFGIVVIEALAVGRPVLISNKVNIWRELRGDGAALVEEDSVEGMSKLLNDYFAMPEEQKLSMRQAAARSFDQRFEIGIAAHNLHTALERAISLN